MNTSKAKALAFVFVLFLCVGLISVGCKQKPKSTWVNTSSMPGQTFSNHSQNTTNSSNSTIVYLGQEKNAPENNFGPSDISFEFRSLK